MEAVLSTLGDGERKYPTGFKVAEQHGGTHYIIKVQVNAVHIGGSSVGGWEKAMCKFMDKVYDKSEAVRTQFFAKITHMYEYYGHKRDVWRAILLCYDDVPIPRSSHLQSFKDDFEAAVQVHDRRLQIQYVPPAAGAGGAAGLMEVTQLQAECARLAGKLEAMNRPALKRKRTHTPTVTRPILKKSHST